MSVRCWTAWAASSSTVWRSSPASPSSSARSSPSLRDGTPLIGLPGGRGWHLLGAASQAHGYLIIDADTHVEEGHVYGYCPGAQFLD